METPRSMLRGVSIFLFFIALLSIAINELFHVVKSWLAVTRDSVTMEFMVVRQIIGVRILVETSLIIGNDIGAVHENSFV